LDQDGLAERSSNSGLLDKLIAAGKEYIFISNVDNLGAVVDLNIMQTMLDSQAEYVMEVTDKTKADIKGGTIIDYEGKARLLEVAQVPKDHLDEFCSTRKFKICKWLSMKAIYSARFVAERASQHEQHLVQPPGDQEGHGRGRAQPRDHRQQQGGWLLGGGIESVSDNAQVTDKGQAVIQLETAIGAAIKVSTDDWETGRDWRRLTTVAFRQCHRYQRPTITIPARQVLLVSEQPRCF
jgi:hypothetical protein